MTSPTALNSLKRGSLRLALAVATLWATVSSSSADAIFSYAGGSPRNDGGQVVGITLTSYGQTIASLGFFDFGGDGLATSYTVGLWDSSQNLIASTVVTPTSPLIGDFRYGSITPVTIGS